MITKLKLTVFIVIILILSSLALEFAFRIMYSIKQKNFRYMTYGMKDVFKINVRHFNGYDKLEKPLKQGDFLYKGFRTEKFPVQKPEHEYRIVALGESSTYGLYGAYEESWPYLLEKKLNDRLGSKVRYRVINAGIPGQTTYEINNLLSAEVLDWNPDLVLLYTLYNHIDIDVFSLYGKWENNIFLKAVKAIFYEKSLLVTHIIDFIVFHSGALDDRLEKYRYLLGEMVKKCKKNNVEVIIIKQLINPDFFDRNYSDKCMRKDDKLYKGKYREFLNVIDEICHKYNCESIDFSAFSDVCKNRMDKILYDGHVHLTAYGNNLLAETVAEKIINRENAGYDQSAQY